MLNKTSRVKIIERHYGRKTIGPNAIFRMVQLSIRRKKPISVIRLGDVMAKLLARQKLDSLDYVSSFLGIRLPPSPELQMQLEQAVHSADIVGLSHYKESRGWIQLYMQQSGWTPPKIADSFINDQLYELGYLHQFIRKNKVALVGRASGAAARQLKRRGLKVALTVALNHADDIPKTIKYLKLHRKKYNLVLVGASVPGRILCSTLKEELRVTAIEIGHMMDAFSKPNDWKKPGNRKRFKFRFLRKQKKQDNTAAMARLRRETINKDRTPIKIRRSVPLRVFRKNK